MAEIEAKGQSSEARIIVIKDGEASELTGSTDQGVAVLSVMRTALIAAIDGGFVQTSPFSAGTPEAKVRSVRQKSPKTPPAGSKLTLADLRTPKHFQDYFIYRMGMFLGKEVSLPLPSKEHVDRGQRIKDAGLTTFEPVVFPNLTIREGFQYPANWKFSLDPWIYQQIKEGNLTSDVLNLEETWGWLDTSERLDWKSGDPMFDPKTDQVLVDLLTGFRAKGKEEGIEITRDTEHLNPGSWYGISAVETRMKVFPAIAGMIGVREEEVVDLTAAQHNFIGNWLYRHLGEKNSWDWLRNSFGVDSRLVVGYRGDGGLGYVSNAPSGGHDDGIRPRPLVLSLSVA